MESSPDPGLRHAPPGLLAAGYLEYCAMNMSKRNISKIAVLVFLFGLTGCEGFGFLQETVPLEDVIADHKFALQHASQQAIFDQFVRYSELGYTFSLYSLADATIEIGTQLSTTGTRKASANIGSLLASPSASIGAERSVVVKRGQDNKVTVKYMPLGNKPKVYKQIKDVFRELKNEPNRIYGLLYTNKSNQIDCGNTGETAYACEDKGQTEGVRAQSVAIDKKKFDELCSWNTLCFHLPEMDRTDTEFWYAYLYPTKKAECQFRVMMDIVREIALEEGGTSASWNGGKIGKECFRN